MEEHLIPNHNMQLIELENKFIESNLNESIGKDNFDFLKQITSNKNSFTKTAGKNSVVTVIYLTASTAITIGDMSN